MKTSKRNENIAKTVQTDRLTLHTTTTGRYYLPTDAVNDGIRFAIINNKIFDEPVYAVAKRYIKPGTIVFDVGSNFGQMAVLFSRLANGGGSMHSKFKNLYMIFFVKTYN
jgi:hypothetical protein